MTTEEKRKKLSEVIKQAEAEGDFDTYNKASTRLDKLSGGEDIASPSETFGRTFASERPTSPVSKADPEAWRGRAPLEFKQPSFMEELGATPGNLPGALDAAGIAAGNEVAMGMLAPAMGAQSLIARGDVEHPVASTVGRGIGFAASLGGGPARAFKYAGEGAGAAGRGLMSMLKGVGSGKAGQYLGRTIPEGAVTMGGYEGAKSALAGDSPETIAKTAGIAGTVGAVVEPALSWIGGAGEGAKRTPGLHERLVDPRNASGRVVGQYEKAEQAGVVPEMEAGVRGQAGIGRQALQSRDEMALAAEAERKLAGEGWEQNMGSVLGPPDREISTVAILKNIEAAKTANRYANGEVKDVALENALADARLPLFKPKVASNGQKYYEFRATPYDLIEAKRVLADKAGYGAAEVTPEMLAYRNAERIFRDSLESLDPRVAAINSQYKQARDALSNVNDVMYGRDVAQTPVDFAARRRGAGMLANSLDETKASGTTVPEVENVMSTKFRSPTMPELPGGGGQGPVYVPPGAERQPFIPMLESTRNKAAVELVRPFGGASRAETLGHGFEGMNIPGLNLIQRLGLAAQAKIGLPISRGIEKYPNLIEQIGLASSDEASKKLLPKRWRK